MRELDNKVVLITGAGRGIGAESCRVCLEHGARVVATDIDLDAVTGVARALQEQHGDSITAMPLDVRNSESVRSAIEATVEAFGRLDGVFNNAMSAPYINNNDRRVTELDEAVWDEIVGLVLTGAYLVTKYAARQMLQQNSGSIVLTATVDALIGQAGIDAYTAAKGGVVALTRSAAAGLSPEGVRINTICPSFVQTPAQSAFLGDDGISASFQAHHLMGIPTAADIAEFAAFLLSDRTRYVTGGIHAVDSGYTAFKGKMDLRGLVRS